MSYSASPSPRRLTLLTLPSELQLAIFRTIDESSWTCLKSSLGFDPSDFSCHDILDDRVLASAHLTLTSYQDMATVSRMSRTNRHFHNMLSPHLYSRYGLMALRYCLVEGSLEMLHRYFQVTGPPSSRRLNDLVIAASALRNDEMTEELVRLGGEARLIQTFEECELPPLEPTLDPDLWVLPSLFQRSGDPELGKLCSKALLAAVRSDKHVKYVKYLLSQGAMVNMSLTDGSLPLHEAIKFSAEENVRALLQHGANPNYRDTRIGTTRLGINEFPTAMEVALLRGSEQIFVDLAAFDADIGDPKVEGEIRYALEKMALAGTGSRVGYAMFEAGLSFELTAPNSGETYLHCAAEGGCLIWVNMLVNIYHFDVNAVTRYQNTAIEWATGNPVVQQFLLAHGALPPEREKVEPYEGEDYEIMDVSE